MKKYLCIYCLLCMATLACAQNLKFNANGKFKIVQFTDVHYISDDPRSDIAIEPYGFRTWIRVKNHKEQEVTFPESFLKPNK